MILKERIAHGAICSFIKGGGIRGKAEYSKPEENSILSAT